MIKKMQQICLDWLGKLMSKDEMIENNRYCTYIWNVLLVIVSSFWLAFYLIAPWLLPTEQIVLAKPFQQIGFPLTILSALILSFYLCKVIDWRVLTTYLGGYLSYLCVLVTLFVTRNINNPDFNKSNIFKIYFWQGQALPLIAILGLLALGWGVLYKYWLSDRETFLDKLYVPDYWVSTYLLSLTLIQDKALLTLLSQTVTTGLETIQLTTFLAKSFTEMAPFFILVFLCSWLFAKAIRELTHNRSSFSLAVLSSFLFGLVLNYHLQLAVKGEGELLGKFVFPGATLYQILFLMIIALFNYLLLNRYILATIINMIIAVILIFANYLKVEMRSEPLLVTDLAWLSEPQFLLSFVKADTLLKFILALVIFVVFYIFCGRKLLKGKLVKSLVLRICLVFSLVGFVNAVLQVFRDEDYNKIAEGWPIISKLNNWQDINWLGFETNARYKSVAFVWTKQLSKKIMVQPETYSQESMEALYAKYLDRASSINQERDGFVSDQTIIYILSESFADPARLPGLRLTETVIPNVTDLKEQTTSGLMKADFYGGGTANMEFQSLTGLPLYNFSPSIAVLYTEVAPRMQQIPSISDSFISDHRIVIHPSNAKNYDRYRVYEKLGFHKFLAQSGSSEELSGLEAVGLHIGDKVVYQNILNLLDSEQNQFFSAITMQNHAPWSSDTPEDLFVEGEGFTEEQNTKLSNYARLIWHTDKDTQTFLEQLESLPQKITLVFYGDHLPGLYPETVFEEHPELQFQTDYFIWSNHENQKLSYPLVNSSDFPALLLRHTNTKVSPYYALLTDVLDKVSISVYDIEMTDEQKQIVEDLKLVQYDLTVGKGYLLQHSDFFEFSN